MSSPTPDLDLVIETAIEDTVATASPVSGRWMTAELERRGPEAVWTGACQLLAPLAARPAYGQDPAQGTDRLRAVVRSAQPDVALALAVRLAYQVEGEEGAAGIWEAEDIELQRAALMHLLISYCFSIGFGGRRLGAAPTVALIREAFLNRPARPAAAPLVAGAPEPQGG
ncbi:hypothetical protein ACGF12_14045 [Kitasatospora sp. NPDC048296]|uniref:hypothetical protein n=1 Tax=Kitasatospora sp. NPDC048296 TaxID=3364048 RepID=UPI0037116155